MLHFLEYILLACFADDTKSDTQRLQLTALCSVFVSIEAGTAGTHPSASRSDVCQLFASPTTKSPSTTTFTRFAVLSKETMSSDAPKRIAISFSSNKPAKTTSAKPGKPQPPSALGKRPRTDPFGGDSDSDSDGHVKQEKITGFGADGAETGSRKEEVKKEYIIAKQPNKDWRAEKRQKSGLPGREQGAGENGFAKPERAEADQDSGIKWGLTVKEKVKTEPEDDVKKEPTSDEDTPNIKTEESERVVTKEDFGAPDDPDKEALSALLNQPSDKPQHTIPSESDAYQRDITATGEASTLSDYEDMPVEEFGAALLRGMGWDGKERGTMRYKEVRKRPARLGLGAKELKGDEELGGWGQKGSKKRPRLDEYKREKEKERERRDARRGDGGRDEKSDRRDKDRDYERRRDDRRYDDRRRDDDGRRDRHRDDRDRRR